MGTKSYASRMYFTNEQSMLNHLMLGAIQIEITAWKETGFLELWSVNQKVRQRCIIIVFQPTFHVLKSTPQLNQRKQGPDSREQQTHTRSNY